MAPTSHNQAIAEGSVVAAVVVGAQRGSRDKVQARGKVQIRGRTADPGSNIKVG